MSKRLAKPTTIFLSLSYLDPSVLLKILIKTLLYFHYTPVFWGIATILLGKLAKI